MKKYILCGLLFLLAALHSVSSQYLAMDHDRLPSAQIDLKSTEIKADLHLLWSQQSNVQDIGETGLLMEFQGQENEKKSGTCWACYGAIIGAVGGLIIGIDMANYYEEDVGTGMSKVSFVLKGTAACAILGGGFGLLIDIAEDL